MFHPNRILKVFVQLTVSTTMLAGLIWTLSTVEATLPSQQLSTSEIKQRVVQTERGVSDRPSVIGLPCGSGELMDPETICLHGRVLVESATSTELTALNNIQVDVSYADQTLSAFTFLHAGEGEPTYGIDISPLQPAFMDSVTVTAYISGTVIERLVSVYPNFDTHNQEYDIIVPDTAAFDGQVLWGHVVDYSVGGPVSGALVTATYGSPQQQVVVTTAESDEHGYPVYSFFAADLPGIGTGDTVTLTAEFAGDSFTQLVTIEGEDPIQQNLLTGWKCNDFDPFPRFGGGGAFPRFGGGGAFPGFPDAICIWGFGLGNGIPTEGIKVQVEVNGQFFEGMTKVFPGESVPRYGIALPNVDEIINQPIIITALFNGFTTEQIATLTPKDSPVQQVDLNVIGVKLLNNLVNGNDIVGHVWLDGALWVATNGGVNKWDPNDSTTHTSFTPSNSELVGFHVNSIKKDSLGRLYFRFDSGELQRYTPSSDKWELLDLPRLTDPNISFEYDANPVWFTHSEWDEGLQEYRSRGAYRLDINSDKWKFYPSDLYSDEPTDISLGGYVVDEAGNTWFASLSKLRKFNFDTETWDIFPNRIGPQLSISELIDIEIAPDQSIWIGTDRRGLYRYEPDSEQWTQFSVINSGINSNESINITIDDFGKIYLSTNSYEIQVFNPSENSWEPFGTSEDLCPCNLFFGPNGDLWSHGHIGRGLLQWKSGQSVKRFRAEGKGPLGDTVNLFLEDPNGKVWFSTSRGISAFDPRIGDWEYYTDGPDPETNSPFYPSNFAVTPDGIMWGTRRDGIWIFDPKTDDATYIDPSNSPLLGTQAEVIWEGICECIVISSSNGINRYFPEADTWESWPSDQIYRMIPLKDGNILASRGGGWFLLNPENGVWTQQDDIKASFASQVSSSSKIIEDSDGALWGARSTGDFVKRSPNGEVNVYSTDNPQFEDFGHMRFDIDSYDRLWGINAATFFVFDPLDDSWQFFDQPTTIQVTGNLTRPLDLTIGLSDVLWISTHNGALRWFIPIQHSDPTVDIQGTDRFLELEEGDATYTITVSNIGEIASVASLTLDFPISSTIKSSSFTETVNINNPINLGVLKAGEKRTYEITLGIDEGWQAGDIHRFRASVDGGDRESILSNNNAELATKVVAPDQVDLLTSLSGPPTLIPGEAADLTLIVANEGTKVSSSSLASMQLPEGVTFINADSEWDIPPLEVGKRYILTTTVLVDDPFDPSMVQIGASVQAVTGESNLTNNTASISLPVSASGVRTLILVAPNRLAETYDPSTVINELYQLAEHPNVEGLVINLENEETVQQAYAEWDTAPADWTLANQTAEAIQAVLNGYLEAYNTIEYIVLIGGDSIIPHYRMSDHNETQWQERNYAVQVEGHPAVHAAMLANKLLTDDFYADPNPKVPQSYFWTHSDPVFVPDYAIGRLVETPDEISAVIESFLTNDGVITIDDAVLGGDDFLAGDLVTKQCDLLSASGLTANCANSDLAFAHIFEQTTPSSAWTSFHSNHYSMGLFGESLQAKDLFNIKVSDTFMGTIGCHAGLNVADAQQVSDLDLAQGIAFNGGTTIGSTAYTYGSSWEINYTEALMVDFTQKLLSADKQPLGKVLQEAKRDYFARRAWFGPLDAKTLIPMSLYGLPMLEYDLPDSRIKATANSESLLLTSGKANEIVTMTFNGADYEEIITADGSYFTFRDQTLAQFHQPIQPAHSEEIPFEKDGKVLKGILLHDSTYQDIVDFDPVINESWVMGAQTQQNLVEPVFDNTDWDRDLPVGYTVIEGENGPRATLNYVPGLFNADSNTERLFSSISVELLYGVVDESDLPYLTFANLETRAGGTEFKIGVDKEPEHIEKIVVVYEVQDGWSSIELEYDLQLEAWAGKAPAEVSRYRIQIVDTDGNLNDPGWLVDGFGDTPSSNNSLYLPIIQK